MKVADYSVDLQGLVKIAKDFLKKRLRFCEGCGNLSLLIAVAGSVACLRFHPAQWVIGTKK